MSPDAWCGNCLEAPAITQRFGYDCCDLCAEAADRLTYRSGCGPRASKEGTES